MAKKKKAIKAFRVCVTRDTTESAFPVILADSLRHAEAAAKALAEAGKLEFVLDEGNNSEWYLSNPGYEEEEASAAADFVLRPDGWLVAAPGKRQTRGIYVDLKEADL